MSGMTHFAPRPDELEAGFRLDRYELLCVLARGGMGSVWLARLEGKHGFEKLVAVKTILPMLAADSQFQRMFLDEARIASAIIHPNVVQTIDLGEQHGVLYTVMEWVDGDPVRALQLEVQKRGGRIPLGIVLRVVADACAGLHAAHELKGSDGTSLGIVHRDVSPQNILVSASGAAKIIDFGIAKARDRLCADTTPDQIKGKIDYMAPEQAVGDPVDRRTDVWGMGAVIYGLVAGHPPFRGNSGPSKFRRLVSGEPPAPLPVEVPPAVRALVERCLSPRPSDRFQSAAELARAIEEALKGTDDACTHTDVAVFLSQHLGREFESRRKLVCEALRAARAHRRREAPWARCASGEPSASISAHPVGGSSSRVRGGLEAAADTTGSFDAVGDRAAQRTTVPEPNGSRDGARCGLEQRVTVPAPERPAAVREPEVANGGRTTIPSPERPRSEPAGDGPARPSVADGSAQLAAASAWAPRGAPPLPHAPDLGGGSRVWRRFERRTNNPVLALVTIVGVGVFGAMALSLWRGLPTSSGESAGPVAGASRPPHSASAAPTPATDSGDAGASDVAAPGPPQAASSARAPVHVSPARSSGSRPTDGGRRAATPAAPETTDDGF
jgi:serine/threonine-protein kinase